MITLPKEFSRQISVFAPLFSKKVFEHAKVLVAGGLLVIGRRTVCSALRAVCLGDERRFHKYHRVLSRAKWCSRKCARVLLLLLIARFTREGDALVFGIDETIERRRGKKINAKGIYRDSVRSSKSHMVKCSGLRWMNLMLLTPISGVFADQAGDLAEAQFELLQLKRKLGTRVLFHNIFCRKNKVGGCFAGAELFGEQGFQLGLVADGAAAAC